jgi:hypothetical protein
MTTDTTTLRDWSAHDNPLEAAVKLHAEAKAVVDLNRSPADGMAGLAARLRSALDWALGRIRQLERRSLAMAEAQGWDGKTWEQTPGYAYDTMATTAQELTQLAKGIIPPGRDSLYDRLRLLALKLEGAAPRVFTQLEEFTRGPADLHSIARQLRELPVERMMDLEVTKHLADLALRLERWRPAPVWKAAATATPPGDTDYVNHGQAGGILAGVKADAPTQAANAVRAACKALNQALEQAALAKVDVVLIQDDAPAKQVAPGLQVRHAVQVTPTLRLEL